MKPPVALALLAATVALVAFSSAAAGTTSAATRAVATTPASMTATTPVVAIVSTVVQTAPVPARGPSHAAPPAKAVIASAPNPAAAAAPATAATRTAYINALYASLVPAGERAALAGRYVLGYNLPGLNCGTGCTGLFDGQARSSFDNTFFSESLPYQRSRVAHEAAHAYGFLFISDYATPSWATVGGWQTQFNGLDRSFVKTYDAEAWAACVAWKETGFNNRVDQISGVCTAQSAVVAMAQIP